MKLLIQSDDFGITPGVSEATVSAITEGVVRNTGLFTNMPWSKDAAQAILPYIGRIALGADMNLSVGYPMSGSKAAPSLVQNDGSFLSSRMMKALDRENPRGYHAEIDEVEKEFSCQIQRFMELVGEKPAYLHPHAVLSAGVVEALERCSQTYDIPVTFHLWKEKEVFLGEKSWYADMSDGDAQLNTDVEKFITTDVNGLLTHPLCAVVCHCGHVDETLLRYSSYSYIREKDFLAMTGIRVKTWVRENDIQLITYYDLLKGES